jgi:hypothetical protein
MLKVEFNGKLFDILNDLSITKASNEVNFDDITIDFTGHTIDELPIKYQEIKLVEYNKIANTYIIEETNKEHPSNNEYSLAELYTVENEEEKFEYEITDTLYYGFLEDYTINSRKNEDEDITLTMTLLTPMKMTTVRYITLFGEYTLSNLIQKILEPLLKDGFNIKTIDVPERTYNVKWNLKDIESAMNIIANIYNLWWYIDEQKNISIYNIENLLNKNAKIQITKENILNGMYEFIPELNTQNYANQLSIKNARVVRKAEGCGVGDKALPRIFFDRLSKFYNDEEYEFDNPIVFYKPNEYSSNQLLFRVYTDRYAIFVTGMLVDGTIRGYYYIEPWYAVDSEGNVKAGNYVNVIGTAKAIARLITSFVDSVYGDAEKWERISGIFVFPRFKHRRNRIH